MTDTQELQQVEYTGNVRELGGVELSRNQKEKKRKVVVSDKPEYAGKTFRVWHDTPEWASLEAAAGSGDVVTIGYTPTPVTFGDKSWTENSIDWVALGVGQGNDWGQQQEAPVPVAEPEGWGAPAPVAAPVQPAPQPVQKPAAHQPHPNKDKLITVTAITKSLIEGGYCPVKPTDEASFRKLVSDIVAMVEGLAK